MSIFAAKDAGVNILTHLYQLEFDPAHPLRSELDEWMERYRTKDFAAHKSPVMPPDQAPSGQYASDFNFFVEGSEEIEELNAVAALWPAVRRIMEYMAITDPLAVPSSDREAKREQFQSDVEQINTLSALLRSSLNVESTVVGSDVFPVVLSYGISDGAKFAGSRFKIIYDVVIAMLDALPKGRSAFARCPTCRNVFVVGRKGQLRCSRRCNDREATRKWLKNKQT